MGATSPYILDRHVTTEPGDSASFPFDRVEENRVFEERTVTANMSVQGVKLNDWASRIVSLEGGGGSGPSGDAVVFNTLTDVGTNSIAADVDFIVVGGYADAGDCPPLPLKRVASEPIHEGKKQSADGAWWEYYTNGPVYLEWFGGKGDYYIVTRTGIGTGSTSTNPSPTDNRAAFYDAMEFLFPYGGTTIVAGGTIQFGYGAYYMSDELVLDRSLCLRGMGLGYYHDGSHSRLIFAAGKKGIVLNHYPEGVPSAGGSHISHLFLQSLGHGGQTTKHGIEMDVSCSIEHCTIRGFGGNGIDITADVGVGSNSNCFYLSHLVIYSNAGHGVYCSGGDANAGIGTAINAIANGGYGIRDDGFLGNTWIGCHTSTNTTGAYYLVGGGSRAVLLGCYSESDQPGSYVGSAAHVYGGLHGAGVTIDGLGFVNNSIYPHHLASQESGDELDVYVRRYANRVLQVTAPSGDFHTMWIEGYGYGTMYGETNTLDAYISGTDSITAGRAISIPPKMVVNPYGVFIGGLESGTIRYLGCTDVGQNLFISGLILSQSLLVIPGVYGKGDTFIDSSTAAGGSLGYICTTAGGYAAAWISGRSYVVTGGSGLLTHIKTAAGRFYQCMTAGGGTSTVEPSHTAAAGAEVAESDGYVWRYLTATQAVFKRAGPVMGDATTVVDDPIFNTSQTWNDAAVTFRGHKTNITSTASAAASMLHDWQVSSSTQANIRKDGRIAATASTAPVAGGAQTIQMTSTAGLGVYAGADAPTVSAAKGSLYLRTNGSTTNDRMYVNTDGGTTWTAVTTAA
jgi:hypothetical protein